MPRRKEQKIVLSQLQKSVTIYQALKNDPIFEGYDLSTFTISVKANITPVIKDAARSAKFLESSLAANPDCCKEFIGVPCVSKQTLAKMMRVPRTTLDKWLDDDLIIPIYMGDGETIPVFNPYEIFSQLKRYKK